MRVAACCSSNPRHTRGVGFLRHLSCVSRAIDRAHTAHLSCVYPVLMSLCDVCVCVCVFCSACCSTCCGFLKIYVGRPTLAWHKDVYIQSPTFATAVCPFAAAMQRQLAPSFATHIISGMPPSLHSTCTHAAPCVSYTCVRVCVCV